MPLDPQVQAVVDATAAQSPPPIREQGPGEARRNMLLLAEAMGPGEEVARVEDRTLPGSETEIPVRVYTPQGHGPFPVVCFYHGGGWVCGDLETHDAFCRGLTNASGCVVVSVGYRCAPEHKFPAAVVDAHEATTWVAKNAAAIQADPTRLAVCGDSAGGNLAAAVALKARDRGGLSIAFQALIYPVIDRDFETASYRENSEGYILTRDSMMWFWEQYLERDEDATDPYAAPLRAASLQGLPPAWVMTAEYDPLCDEGDAYARAMEAAGVAVELVRYEGMIHGFIRQLPFFDRARTALDDLARALKEGLKS